MIVLLFNASLAYSEGADRIQLTWDTVLAQAIEASFDRKLAETDVAISRKEQAIVKADYLPSIQGRFATEYQKDLDNTGFQPVVSVGNTVLPTGTRYQTSAGLSGQITLVDFGERRAKRLSARSETARQEAKLAEAIKLTRLRALETYKQAFVAFQQWEYQQRLVPLHQQLYGISKRLSDAGVISKIQLADDAIALAQRLSDVEKAKQDWVEALGPLRLLTLQPYDPENIALTGFTEITAPIQLATAQQPEVQALGFEIEKKRREQASIRSQLLPKVSSYSSYSLYGANATRWAGSVSNLQQRLWTLGISVQLPITDTVRTTLESQRAQLQIDRLTLEKAKKETELQQQWDSAQWQANQLDVQQGTQATLLSETGMKEAMLSLLSDEQLIERSTVIRQHLEILKRQGDAELLRAEKAANAIQRQLLAGG
ncbi:MAG: TolC family protein [Vampirovibrionales bacterium]|nr:TolC family protein [Vampirovibrionales bacterium]